MDQSLLTLRSDEAVAKVFEPMISAQDTLARLQRQFERHRSVLRRAWKATSRPPRSAPWKLASEAFGTLIRRG